MMWLPSYLISVTVGFVFALRRPVWFSRCVKKTYTRIYNLDMAEAHVPEEGYPSLRELFSRDLKPGTRPILHNDRIISPADGIRVGLGTLKEGKAVQAKGQNFLFEDLFSSPQKCPFIEANYATVYLSPRDYHGVHSPMSGRILNIDYVSGRLFPVNNAAQRKISNLYIRNERMTFTIKNEHGDMLSLTMIGALNVGNLCLSLPEINPEDLRKQKSLDVNIQVKAGQKIGFFSLGSCTFIGWKLKEDSPLKDLEESKIAAQAHPTPLKVGESLY